MQYVLTLLILQIYDCRAKLQHILRGALLMIIWSHHITHCAALVSWILKIYKWDAMKVAPGDSNQSNIPWSHCYIMRAHVAK